MFDKKSLVCKGYSDYPVEGDLVCNTWKPEDGYDPDENS
jgi:hypothetical protein